MLHSPGWSESPRVEETEAQLKLLAWGSAEMRTQVYQTSELLVSGC